MINYGTDQNMRWLPNREEVQFPIYIGDRPITCRVTHDWLSRNFGEPEEGKDWLNVAKEHFSDITDGTDLTNKITRRVFEPDGSILLK